MYVPRHNSKGTDDRAESASELINCDPNTLI